MQTSTPTPTPTHYSPFHINACTHITTSTHIHIHAHKTNTHTYMHTNIPFYKHTRCTQSDCKGHSTPKCPETTSLTATVTPQYCNNRCDLYKRALTLLPHHDIFFPCCSRLWDFVSAACNHDCFFLICITMKERIFKVKMLVKPKANDRRWCESTPAKV